MSTARKLALLVVVAAIAWLVVLYVWWGGGLGPYAGKLLCPSDLPNCHDPEPFPIGAWLAGIVVVSAMARLTIWRVKGADD